MLRYLEKGITLKMDSTKCKKCTMCIQVCPHAVFGVSGRDVLIKDLGACMECGACANNCPSGAITVKSGVGCASGIINGFIRGTEPVCGCSDGSSSCC